MVELLYIVLALTFISILSLVGGVVFTLTSKYRNALIFWISFSSGILIGNVFFEIIPHIGKESIDVMSQFMVLGILSFFFIEKFLRWIHCHKDHTTHVHPVGWMNLVGDGIHNFFDGIAIGTAFMVDVHLGILTSIAIALHEIPQEIGDFGILLHAGFGYKKALLWNFFTSFLSLGGGVLGFMLISSGTFNLEPYLMGFIAGGFLYVSLADLIPELHEVNTFRYNLLIALMFILGLSIMYAI